MIEKHRAVDDAPDYSSVTGIMDMAPLLEKLLEVLKRSGGLILSARLFLHGGFEVVEVTEKIWQEDFKRIMWVRLPMSQIVVDGKPNPIFSEKFKTESEEKKSRVAVQIAFDKHWKGELDGGSSGTH